MNLYNYLQTVQRLWHNGDGNGVARFLTLNGNHVSQPNLHIENPENAVERQIQSPLEEVVSSHIKVLFYLHQNRKLI
jgi:nuclear mRNA export protein PCID2/THP1